MVRFIHISDVHLGFEQYGRYERFKDFGRAFNHAVEMGIREKVDFFLIAGDLFNKKHIKASTLLQADQILTKASSAGIPVIVCEGNHDSLSYGDNWSWLSYLSRKGLIILLGLPFRSDSSAGKGDREGIGQREASSDEGVDWGKGEDEIGEVGGGETGGPVGAIELQPWDESLHEGNYIEKSFGEERVRIYGFGYLGAATKRRISELSASLIRDNAINIGILHAGVEGVIANMHGTIPENALRPFKEKLDYLALGHIHKRFEIENWVFNPGSLENWSLDESGPKNPHGLYLVEIRGNEGDAPGHPSDPGGPKGISAAVVNPTFIDGSSWRRPFSVMRVNLDGVSSQERIMEKVVPVLTKYFYSGMIPNIAVEEQTESSHIPNPRSLTQAPLKDRPGNHAVNFGTLDAYIRNVGNNAGGTRGRSEGEGQENELEGRGQKNELGEGKELEHEIGGNEPEHGIEEEYAEEDTAENDTNETRGGDEGEEAGHLFAVNQTPVREEPVMIIRLQGSVSMKEKIEIDPIRDYVTNSIRPSPLYLEIRDETTREGFVVEEDDSSSKEELERHVIMELLSQGEYGAHAAELHTIMSELRQAVASKDATELNSFDEKIRKFAEEIYREPKSENTMKEQ